MLNMIAYFQVTFWGGWLMYLQPSEIIVLLTYKIIFNFFNCSELNIFLLIEIIFT